MKPLSPAEHDRLIEEFIRAKGVTKCPPGVADWEDTFFDNTGGGIRPIGGESGCLWRIDPFRNDIG